MELPGLMLASDIWRCCFDEEYRLREFEPTAYREGGGREMALSSQGGSLCGSSGICVTVCLADTLQ